MIERATVAELQTAMGSGNARVIDVREFAEFQSGHVPGAVHIPMHTVPLRLADIPSDGSVYVICESGSRSWQVAAFLLQRGITAVDVQGGTGFWRMAGYPLESEVAA